MRPILVLSLLCTACPSNNPTTGPCRLDVECDPGLVCCTQPSMRNGMCSTGCDEPACTDGSECSEGTTCCPGHSEASRTCRPTVVGEMTPCGACEDDEGCPGDTICCGTGAATFCATSCDRESFDASLPEGGPVTDAGPMADADTGMRGDAGPCEPEGIDAIVISGDSVDLGAVTSIGTAPVVGRDQTVVFRTFLEGFRGDRNEALIRASSDGVLDVVASVGGSLPTEGGTAEVLAIQGNPVVATDGSVGYQVVLEGGDNAAYAYDPTTMTSTLLVRENQAGAGPQDEPFALLEPFTLRNRRSAYNGALVFHSFFVSTDPSPSIREPRGVWQVAAGSTPSVVILDDGQPVGIPIDTATYGPAEPQVAITSSNVVAIATGIRRAPSAGFDIDRGLFRFGRTGDEQIDVAESFTGAYVQLNLNAGGDIAYVETGPAGTGVIRETGPVAAAARGEAVPGLAGATFVAPSDGLAYLNDGRVVFLSEVMGGERDGARGVFEETDAGLRTLAIEGQEIESGLSIRTIQTVHTNNEGGVALRVQLEGAGVRSGFDTAILMTNPAGELELMLRADTDMLIGCNNRVINRVSLLSDLIPGTEAELFGPGHAGLPHAITDAGSVAVHIAFVPEGATEFEAIVLVEQPES